MTLSPTTKLSHYEIIYQLGKGGMGEVYQAKDTKLGRDVAIKVLPEEFAQDADRIARFQREAKLLASLNHPNIAAIHGLEEVDGTNFLVMELVEGNTLDERIKSGSIPVEETLKLALQIAEALEAAHEKGVIHRDLKPANIKVTPDGKGQSEFLSSAPNYRLLPRSWADNGKTLILDERSPSGTTWDITSLPIEGDHKLTPVLDNKYMERSPQVSPDGQWLAYTSNESGQEEVYVRLYTDVDSGGEQASIGGGRDPLWSRDGNELFYRASQSIWVVSVETDPSLSFETPETLFTGNYYAGIGWNWAIHPDGDRFLLLKPVNATEDKSATEDPRKIIIIKNWFEELKEKVSVP